MTNVTVTPGVVLSRRPHREYERVVFLYTKELGKVPARFAGIDRPRGKLKALSEPMVHAEYRLHQRTGSPWATVTGGQIITSFPVVRADLNKTLAGLEMCELLMQLSPDGDPSPEKYDLLVEYLSALGAEDSPWSVVSFGLRLFQLAGIGPDFSRIATEDLECWKNLQRSAPRDLAAISNDVDVFHRLRSVFEQQAETHMERPLNARLFRESMSVFALRAAAPVPASL